MWSAEAERLGLPSFMKFRKMTRLLTACCVLVSLAVPAHAQLQPETVLSATIVLPLEEAISKALASSPRLAAAQAALAASQGAERQAGVWANPEVGVEAENVAGSGAYRGTDSAEITYSVSQKLELGKRSPRRRMASAEREGIDIALKAEQLDIARDVKRLYGDVLVAEAQLKLAQAQEQLADDVLVNVAKRVGAARDPLIYQTQAEVSQATARMAKSQAQRALELAKKKLSTVWGGAPLTRPLDSAVLTNIEQPLALETYLSQLANNPDVRRFNAMKLAKQSAFALEKAQNLPDPSLSVGVRTFRESHEQAMTVGISLPIPVFDQNQGNIARARAEVHQVESASLAAVLGTEQALHEAWQEWQSAHEESVQLRDSVLPNAEKAFTLSREGYDRGRFSYLEILNAQRTLWDARGQYSRSLQRQLNAKADVERLTATPIISSTNQGESK